MEPNKLDKAIRESLNGHLSGSPQGDRDRVWQAVERQLETPPSHNYWKVAALILLLLLPSAALWMQNRKQAATIQNLVSSLDLSRTEQHNRIPSEEPTGQRQPEIIRDTVVLRQPAVIRIQTDTIRQIQIVKDTVILYRSVELAKEPQHESGVPSATYHPVLFNPENLQESQRAEFLLEPDHPSHRSKNKKERTFSFRFSLGASGGNSESPVGIQTRL